VPTRPEAIRRPVELGAEGEGEVTAPVRRDVEILHGPCHIVGYGSVAATL
jgi:hypothetical protein